MVNNLIATKRALRKNNAHLGIDAPRMIEAVARHSACEMLLLDLIDTVVESEAFAERAVCKVVGGHRFRLSVLTPSSAVISMYRDDLSRIALGA